MICGGGDGGAAANCRSVTISGNAGGTAPKSTAMSTCSATQNLHHWRVRLKRRKVLIVLVVTVATVCVLTLWPKDEPKYQGRYLSDWVAIRGPAPYGSSERAQAEVAIQNIGTNALPYLLEWMDYQTPEWKLALHRKLPRWIQGNSTYGRLIFSAASRANHSYVAIDVLGTNALSAIPALEAMLTNRTKEHVVQRAIYALNYLGEPGFLTLQQAFADTNQLDRSSIVRSIGYLASFDITNARQALLLRALNDTDDFVRGSATNIIQHFAPHLLTNAPAQ